MEWICVFENIAFLFVSDNAATDIFYVGWLKVIADFNRRFFVVLGDELQYC